MASPTARPLETRARPRRLPRRRYVPVLFLLGAQTAAAAVSIVGVDGPVLENVQQFVGDTPACTAADAVLDRFAARLPQRLRPALDAFGFYSAKIEPQPVVRAADCWELRVAIEQGEPTRVRSVEVLLEGEAEADPRMQGVLDTFPLLEGDVLEHRQYLEFKSRLETLARDRGYVGAHFTRQAIDVYVDEAAADIELVFDSGPRYAFGDVTFDTTALAPEVLERFVGFRPGEPYDAALVGRLQRDLAGSEYFTATSVIADLDAARNREIPIRVNATAGTPVSYSVGVGYSTDDGVRFRFMHENRRRNPEGHQTRTDVLLSHTRQNAVFDYRVPKGNPQRDWLSFRGGLEREDTEAGIGTIVRGGVRRTRVGEFLTSTRSLDLQYERDRVSGETLETTLLVPGTSWIRIARDDLARPRRGHRLSLDLLAGLGTQVSLLHADWRGKWIGTTPWTHA